MRLEWMFLADAATILQNGLFDVIGGGFDLLTVGKFPATKFGLVVIGRVWFTPQECENTYEMTSVIVGPQGKIDAPEMKQSFKPKKHAREPDKRENWMTVCLNYQAVVFPAPGDYFIRLSISGEKVGEVKVEAVATGEGSS